jgi:hypothetical protein
MQHETQQQKEEQTAVVSAYPLDPHIAVETTQKASPFVKMTHEEILRGLNSRNADLHSEAFRAGRRLVVVPEQLLALAEREAKIYRQRAYRGTLISLGTLSGVAIIGILLIGLFSSIANISNLIFLTIGITSLGLAVWLQTYLPQRARRSLIELVSTLDDPRFIGPALTMLVPDGITESQMSRALNPHIRDSITDALKNMLPRLRASDNLMLSRPQMQTLLFLLDRPNKDMKLTHSVLRALQQIGDETAIPVVERLARSQRGIVADWARETLVYLQDRVDQKRQAQTLLRASGASESIGHDALLRPAVHASDPAPEQLLRPQL